MSQSYHVNRQRRRVLAASGEGATERVEESLERDVDAALGERLARLLDGLNADDINLLARLGGSQWKEGVAAVTKIRLDPRFVKNGFGRLVLPSIKRLAGAAPMQMGELLLLPVFNPRAEKFLADRYYNPSVDDVADLAGDLLADFPASLVAGYLLTVAVGGAPAAEAVMTVVATDARLKLV